MNCSIIIPIHNDAIYLERCLYSCNINDVNEIILINDYSNGENIKIINNIFGHFSDIFKNHNVAFTCINSKINYGLAGSRNKAIEIATSDYILPLDVDDVMYEGSVKKMITKINEGFDIVYGNMTDGPNIDKYKFHTPIIGITKESFMHDNPLWSTSMFTKALWQKVNGYTVYPHSHYEDYNFWCKCQSVGAKFTYIDELIYHHTLRPDSMLGELHSKTEYYKELARKGLNYSTNPKCFVP